MGLTIKKPKSLSFRILVIGFILSIFGETAIAEKYVLRHVTCKYKPKLQVVNHKKKTVGEEDEVATARLETVFLGLPTLGKENVFNWGFTRKISNIAKFDKKKNLFGYPGMLEDGKIMTTFTPILETISTAPEDPDEDSKIYHDVKNNKPVKVWLYEVRGNDVSLGKGYNDQEEIDGFMRAEYSLNYGYMLSVTKKVNPKYYEEVKYNEKMGLQDFYSNKFEIKIHVTDRQTGQENRYSAEMICGGSRVWANDDDLAIIKQRFYLFPALTWHSLLFPPPPPSDSKDDGK